MNDQYLELCRTLSSIQDAWKGAPTADLNWLGNESRLAVHVQLFREGLANLFRLFVSAETLAIPRSTQYSMPDLLGVAHPCLREVVFMNPDSTPFSARIDAAYEDAFARSFTAECLVIDIEQTMTVTNLVRIKAHRTAAIGPHPYFVSLHHRHGGPCHGMYCILPLRCLFHPEERLVIAAESHVRQAARVMDSWAEACEFDYPRLDASARSTPLPPPLQFIRLVAGLDVSQSTTLLLLVPNEVAQRRSTVIASFPLTGPLSELLARYHATAPFPNAYCMRLTE